jgi:hypothetical protein
MASCGLSGGDETGCVLALVNSVEHSTSEQATSNDGAFTT